MSEQKKTKKRGRPPMPKGHAKAKYVPMRLKDKDFKAFSKAAKASHHQTLSGWIRHTLQEATMELHERIEAGAKDALRETAVEIEAVANNNFSAPVNPNEWAVHFTEPNKPPYMVTIDIAGVLVRYGSTSVNAFRQEIDRLLQESKQQPL